MFWLFMGLAYDIGNYECKRPDSLQLLLDYFILCVVIFAFPSCGGFIYKLIDN